MSGLVMAAIGLEIVSGLAFIGLILRWLRVVPSCDCASCAIERMDRTPAPKDVVSR